MKNTIHNTLCAMLIALVLLILPQAECIAATLIITTKNGSVTATPQKAQYDYGEVVQLMPKPETGYCFTGWQGDAQGKRLVLNLTMDSDKTIIANFGAWQPPIGIPMPSFGIFETYRMYDDPANRNPDLTYSQNAEGGYYTHYVDNTDPDANDTNNTYGSIAKPRLTLPRSVVAGSVVEIHGGPYHSSSDIEFGGGGTPSQPSFVRGLNAESKPRFTTRLAVAYNEHIDAQHLIFENLHLWELFVYCYVTVHHITVRNCKVEGPPVAFREAGINVDTNGNDPNAAIHDVVIYNNEILNIGDWQASGDPDGHGIAIEERVSNVWIVDNLLYHNSGNGLQVNAGSYSMRNTTHHIYIGRNWGYENKQDLLWTKFANDVVFSQNFAYRHRASPSSMGGGMGLQYGPKRVWFLFNEIYDCAYGIRMSTDVGPGGSGEGNDTYVIGNVIHDLVAEGGEGNTGILIASEVTERKILCNTIVNVQWGIEVARQAKVEINNNILSGVNGHDIYFYHADNLPCCCNIQYNLFESPAKIRWGSDDDAKDYNLTTFNAAYPGKATGSMEADPLFVNADSNDFHLQSTSPAIGAGMSSGAVQEAFDRFQELYGIDIRKDFEGGPRTEPWDIGAYEYSPASGTFLYGDVNSDGEVSAYDAALAAHIAVDLEHPDIKNRAAAEVSGDGEVSAYDAALIAQKAVGLIDKFPVE